MAAFAGIVSPYSPSSLAPATIGSISNGSIFFWLADAFFFLPPFRLICTILTAAFLSTVVLCCAVLSFVSSRVLPLRLFRRRHRPMCRRSVARRSFASPMTEDCLSVRWPTHLRLYGIFSIFHSVQFNPTTRSERRCLHLSRIGISFVALRCFVLSLVSQIDRRTTTVNLVSRRHGFFSGGRLVEINTSLESSWSPIFISVGFDLNRGQLDELQ